LPSGGGTVLDCYDTTGGPIFLGYNHAVGLATSGANAEEIADAVWDEPRSSHTTAGTFGEQVDKKLLKLTDFLGLK